MSPTNLQDQILGIEDIFTIKRLINRFKSDYSIQYVKNTVSRLSNESKIHRIKKGVYSREKLDYLDIITLLDKDARISFDVPLRMDGTKRPHRPKKYKYYHAITINQPRIYESKDFHIIIHKIKKALYLGTSYCNRNAVNSEEAIIDILYYNIPDPAIDIYMKRMAIETIKKYKTIDISIDRLKQYAKKAGIACERKLGFILDKLGIEERNDNALKHTLMDYTVLCGEDRFNPDWRVYYDKGLFK
ncbi:MAG: hypothetical protein ABII64_02475 [Elusimicrobiota bacterium]